MQKLIRALEVLFVMTLAYGCSMQAAQGPRPTVEQPSIGGGGGAQNKGDKQPAGLTEGASKGDKLLMIPVKGADGKESTLRWSGQKMQGNKRFEVVAGQ